mmetsp:Transcript_23962/g.36450  ORF Transcript_23962/g.36450 Transcript_23962/m.36450 type:complete len:83 (+) Transcript_23962:134-382(+)
MVKDASGRHSIFDALIGYLLEDRTLFRELATVSDQRDRHRVDREPAMAGSNEDGELAGSTSKRSPDSAKAMKLRFLEISDMK